jgi:hypothetical protein
MGIRPTTLLIMGIALTVVLAGCSTGEQKSAGRPVSGVVRIDAFFPDDIHAVDRIEMQMAGGGQKAFIDKTVIDAWIGQIGEIRVTIDADPEESSGVLYQVQFYANGERKLSLTPRTVNGTAIIANDELTDSMDKLWNEGDTRQPSRWGELSSLAGTVGREAQQPVGPNPSPHSALQEINAELSLERTSFYLNQTYDTTMHLKNDGPTALYVGGNYSIEQWDNGTWYQLPLSMNFTARAYNIAPGETFSQNVRVPALLPAGKYRVVKGVQSVDTVTLAKSDPVYLAVEFMIGRKE